MLLICWMLTGFISSADALLSSRPSHRPHPFFLPTVCCITLNVNGSRVACVEYGSMHMKNIKLPLHDGAKDASDRWRRKSILEFIV